MGSCQALSIQNSRNSMDIKDFELFEDFFKDFDYGFVR